MRALLQRYLPTLAMLLVTATGSFAAEKYVTDATKIDPAFVADDDGREEQLYYGSYALLIGQSKYTELRPLPEVKQEMEQLTTTLEEQGFVVTRYLDLDAAGIRSAIEEFVAQYGYSRDARLVFYLSGHGVTRQVQVPTDSNYEILRRTGYFLPIDMPKIPNDPTSTLVAEKAIRLSEFLEWADALEVRHALFVFDSCFSGSIFNTKGESGAYTKALAANYVFSEEARLPVREFIAAGTDAQEVPAQSKFLQVFNQALLGRRPGADSNLDGFLTGSELIAYLKGAVPQENRKQTPTSGRSQSSELSRGDIVFRPNSTKVVDRPAAEHAPDSVTLRALMLGTEGADNTTIAEAYQAERALNVGGNEESRDPSATEDIEITLPMPINLPAQATFSNPRLSCGGNCTAKVDYTIISRTSLSRDKRLVSATIRVGPRFATWRLVADVLVPVEGNRATVFDLASAEIKKVSLETLQTVARIEPETVPYKQAKDAILKMAENDTPSVRRNARSELTKLIQAQEADYRLTTELIRGLPTGSYRYKLAIFEALAAQPLGWTSNESISNSIIEDEFKAVNDKTLRDLIIRTSNNHGVYVFYEVVDGKLTDAGQLTPKGVTKTPYPAVTELNAGIELRANSAVNMRVGATSGTGTVGVLPRGSCVRLVGDKIENPAKIDGKIVGAWLRVKRTCKA
ncbi:hypothetical protein CYK37_21660 [Mesorhizobium loti]|nr:caspase family protein [Mesorhizobium loti]PLP57290.1 hypothetical protein CYK37_21660 [Mesorhizobium loti]